MVLFSLQEDNNYEEDFASLSAGYLHSHYLYPVPNAESDRVETLYLRIRKYYELDPNEISNESYKSR